MKKYRKGVFIVVYYLKNQKPNYLILKRKLHWKGFEFPKGGVKFLEFSKTAVKREVKEEVGLKPIKIKKHAFCGKYPYKKELKDRKKIYGQTFCLYSVEVKRGKVKIDKKEHSAYDWLGFEKILKKLTFSNQRKSLRIVHKVIKDNKN